MCVAYKRLSPEEFAEAEERLQEARLALQDRDEKLTAVYNQVETDMSLIGATAVEDRSGSYTHTHTHTHTHAHPCVYFCEIYSSAEHHLNSTTQPCVSERLRFVLLPCGVESGLQPRAG